MLTGFEYLSESKDFTSTLTVFIKPLQPEGRGYFEVGVMVNGIQLVDDVIVNKPHYLCRIPFEDGTIESCQKDAEERYEQLKLIVRDFKVDNHAITITQEDIFCQDETYAKFYECPECKDTNIFEYSNYCPNCGKPLKWEGEFYE